MSCLSLMPHGKILAVLSSKPGTQSMTGILESFGDSVASVHSFTDAMKVLEQGRVDLIVADVHLQDKNGFLETVFDFLRWVKGDPHLRDIPFLCYMSQEAAEPKLSLEATRTAAISLGASYFSENQAHSGDIRQLIESLLPKEPVQ